MKLISPSFNIECGPCYEDMLKIIEKAARTCYKSEDKIKDGSAKKLIRSCIKVEHESVLEHCVISVRIVCDRGVSHELVRHRLASYSQESQRYCTYKDDVEFILPHWLIGDDKIFVMKRIEDFTKETPTTMLYGSGGCDIYNFNFDLMATPFFLDSLQTSEIRYKELLGAGLPPQDARAVLPNATKTELVMTCNLREWRHCFKLRCAKAAHPEMRRIMIPMLDEFAKRWPTFFNDVWEDQ